MKIESKVIEDCLTWKIIVTGQSSVGSSAASMDRDNISFRMPHGWKYEGLHPDLECVAVVLALRPFIGSVLDLPRPVSPKLAEVLQTEFAIGVENVDDSLRPRRVSHGRVGLCFSGGVDSSAALLALPSDAACFFLDRSSPPLGVARGLYNADAARRACQGVEELGWEVHIVESDLEYVRRPVGFPVFDRSSVESSGVPVVLCAEWMDIDSISWGTIAGVSYGTAFGSFIDHAAVSEHQRWRRLFAAVDLPILNPIAGASEIGTAKMVLGSSLEGLAQACVRGNVGAPCRSCWKCVRKILITASLTGLWPDRDELERLLLVREFRQQLRVSPFPLSDVFCFALNRAPVLSDLVDVMRKRLACGGADLSYLEHWYAPVKSIWPKAYADSVASTLDASIGRMSELEESRFRRWDPPTCESRPEVVQFALATADYFDALAGDLGRWSGIAERDEPYRELALDLSIIEDEVRTYHERVQQLEAELIDIRTSAAFKRGHALVRGAKRVLGRR